MLDRWRNMFALAAKQHCPKWRQPFDKVKGKLVQRGWMLVRENEEVSHVTH